MQKTLSGIPAKYGYIMPGRFSKHEKTFITKNTYNAKSSGYSYATDLSQKESSTNNIKKNSNEFISYLNNVVKIDNCKDL